MNTLSNNLLNSRDIISFTISRDVLLDALTFLSPFVAKRKKPDYDDEDEDDELFPLNEDFFRDKVTFLFYEPYLYLSVLVDGVKVESTYAIETAYKGVSFCVTFSKLKRAVLQHTCSLFIFC